MPDIRFVAFDLDGTLVDSVPDIARAVDDMAVALALPRPDVDTVRGWVGDGIRRLVKRALTGTRDGEPDAALYRQGFEAFRRAYHAHLSDRTRLYPGVREALDGLLDAGLPLACITNKATEFTAPLLQALDLGRYFDCVLCGDSLPARKPDPLPLLHAARHAGIAPSASCMVGDSANDVRAARAAGFYAVAVRYGYGGEALAASAPDASLNALTELLPLLRAGRTGLVRA